VRFGERHLVRRPDQNTLLAGRPPPPARARQVAAALGDPAEQLVVRAQ
jgi:hypothetical protein